MRRSLTLVPTVWWLAWLYLLAFAFGDVAVVTGSSLLQIGTKRNTAHLKVDAQTDAFAEAQVFLESRARGREASSRARHTLFAVQLHRVLSDLKESRNKSNSEVDDLINGFINHHAAEQDKCPARLMEAKHQNNQLHKDIQDLAELINSTESQVHLIKDDLDQVLYKMKEVEMWKDKEANKKASEKDDNMKTLALLKLEMEEMRQIAKPSVTMDIHNRTIVADVKPIALLQLTAAAVTEERTAPNHSVLLEVKDINDVQQLVTETKDVATSMLACVDQMRQQRDEAQRQLLSPEVVLSAVARKGMASEVVLQPTTTEKNCTNDTVVGVVLGNVSMSVRFSHSVASGSASHFLCSDVNAAYNGVIMLHCGDGVLKPDTGGCIKNGWWMQCLEKKRQLEDTYVRAYVELARLIKQYEDLTMPADMDGADGDILAMEESAKREPLQAQANKLVTDQGDKIHQLERLRPRLEDMVLAERRLREHIKKLSEECQMLPATESGLQKVREAIRALETCPGLQRAEFYIPTWTGQWVVVNQDNTKTDAAIDAMALQACVASHGTGVRAAEVSEILSQSVQGMPANNTAPLALLGTCPHCEGLDDDASGHRNAAGHSRICWDPNARLDQASRRLDCSFGPKAVLCVYERIEDLRTAAWRHHATLNS